jgi:hypothetical protein
VCKTKSREGGRSGDAPLSGKTALAMGIPGDGAKGRIWAQANPLVAGRTEDTVGVELSYIGVGTKVLDTLLLGTFGSSALGRWHRDGAGSVGLGLGFCGGASGVQGPCL